VGLARNGMVRVWAGSSTVANALDLDLACFGGAGGTLGGIDVGVTTPDPQAGGGGAGGGGGGGGAGGTGPRTLEGGPGCSAGGGGRDDDDGGAGGAAARGVTRSAGSVAAVMLSAALALAAPSSLFSSRVAYDPLLAKLKT